MDKSVQHHSVFALSIMAQQDTPKGSWVDATGQTMAVGVLPTGITQYEATAGEMVSVTVIGTASMDLNGIATVQVKHGDVVCWDKAAGSLLIKTAAEVATDGDHVYGIVLSDAAASGHAEVLIK